MNQSSLMSFDDALARLLSQGQPVADVEHVPLMDAFDRILAEPITSRIDVPVADNAQMDGYAVRVADVAAALAPSGTRAAPSASSAQTAGSAQPLPPSRPLPISQRIAAGQTGQPLQPGTVARIFTGAPLPDGADAVVMQESSRLTDEGVVIDETPEPGAWIRRRAEDIAAGAQILPAGALLTPMAIGLAASVGVADVAVRRRLRVGCLFTGDELTNPGEPLKPGALYNSNRFMLIALLRRLGCDVLDVGQVPDSLDATRAALQKAAADCDLVVSCGGMSVGEEDHVRPAVEADGELTMWSIAIKPGKPLAHGRIRRAAGGTAEFLGLPGNPVSALVTCLMFGRPFIRRLQGAADVAPPRLTLRADFDWPRPDRRREFLRARVNGDGGLDLFPNQGSAVLTSTVWADGLIDNPAGHAIVRGQPVSFIPFANLLS